MEKYKVLAVSREEAAEIFTDGMAELRKATVDQLRSALAGLADNIARLTTKTNDERTHHALTAQILTEALRQNIDAEPFEDAFENWSQSTRRGC